MDIIDSTSEESEEESDEEEKLIESMKREASKVGQLAVLCFNRILSVSKQGFGLFWDVTGSVDVNFYILTCCSMF